MSKNTARKNAAPVAAVQNAALDWQAEHALIVQAAKNEPGSKGNALGKVAAHIMSERPGAALLRAAGERVPDGSTSAPGAHLFIRASRNTLGKLPRLSDALATGQPYCTLENITESRTGDASVAVALASLLGVEDGASVRQKAVIADAAKRYPQGGNAQMSAALDACCILGIVKRADTGRNAPYVITDTAAARALIPTA